MQIGLDNNLFHTSTALCHQSIIDSKNLLDYCICVKQSVLECFKLFQKTLIRKFCILYLCRLSHLPFSSFSVCFVIGFGHIFFNLMV